jgi:hypothetical protein
MLRISQSGYAVLTVIVLVSPDRDSRAGETGAFCGNGWFISIS